MADIEITNESTDGFTHQGHSVVYTDSYIKVRRSFRQHALRLLRGAPLSIFFEIALADEPSDVQTICANTGYTSTATVCAALDFLVDRHFIQEIGRDGSNGVKRYRAINYAWSGSDRQAQQDIVVEPGRISKNEIRPNERSSEIPPPSTKIRPAKTKIPPPKSEIRPVHDEMNDDVKNQDISKTSSSIHERAAIEKILADGGFEGINVQRLAARLETVELAEQWVQWCADTQTIARYNNPHGIAYGILMERPNMRPHFFKPANLSAKTSRRPTISGKLANRETWFTPEESELIKR